MNLENFVEYVEMAKRMLMEYKYLSPVANLIKGQISTPTMLDYSTPFQSAFSWFKAGVQAKQQDCDVVLIIHVSTLNVEVYKSSTGVLFIAIKKDGTYEVEFLPFIMNEKITFENKLYLIDADMVKDVTKFVLSGWKAEDNDIQGGLV